MGNGSCCVHRDPTCNESMSPILLKRILKDTSNLDSINPVRCLEIKTVKNECLESVHYSNSQQWYKDRPTLSAPQNSNDVKLLAPVEEIEIGRTIPIPDVLRKEDEVEDLACLKPPSAVITESKKTLYSGENNKQGSPQFEYSDNPKNNMDIRTSDIPNEVVDILSRWMKSEKIGLKALIEKLEYNALCLSESKTTGDDMPIKIIGSNVETQRVPSSMRRKQYSRSIPSSINIDGNDISYASGIWPEEGNPFACVDSAEDLLAFSKAQLEHSRLKSLLVSEIVAELPPLSHVFSNMSRGMDAYENEVLVGPSTPASENKSQTENLSIIADIDLLERSIDEKTAKIRKLRRQSVNILTAGYESDLRNDSDGDVKMSVCLELEKKVNQLKNEKANLQKKKHAFVSHLRTPSRQSLNSGVADLLSIREEVPPYEEFDLTKSSQLSVPTLQKRSFSY